MSYYFAYAHVRNCLYLCINTQTVLLKMEKNKSQIIIYQSENGETKLDVRFQDETVWLTQKLMAELFQTSVPNINMHLKNIFDEGELNEEATIKDFLIVQTNNSNVYERLD